MDDYILWIKGQARRHFKRDNKRWGKCSNIKTYEDAIDDAARRNEGKDAYTGLSLDWHLIRRFRSDHKRKMYRNLPTVDHDFGADRSIVFQICSWSVNDCKSDLTRTEWISQMRQILKHLQGDEALYNSISAPSIPLHSKQSSSLQIL